MITPDEIKAKAQRLYPKVIQAWLKGDDLFPYVLNSDKELSGDISEDIQSVQTLRNGSREVSGFGYTVEWKDRRLRASGRNQVPTRILFESRDDLLQLINRRDDFDALATAVRKLRAALPQLEGWIRRNTRLLTKSAEIVDELIDVTQWFQANLRLHPNCFAREIPVGVHGKFIEENVGILRKWFDVEGILESDSVRANEEDFFRRYWLRDWEPLITLRCFDAATQELLKLPCSEASIPLDYFNSVSLNGLRIFVVENLTNLRTLPAMPHSIVIFGMGYAVGKLRSLNCLATNEVIYWGDLDVYGLQILSQFRQSTCAVRSLFMDIQTFRRFRHLMRTPKKDYKPMSLPALLTPEEEEAFVECNALKLQLEQERIPQQAVVDAIRSLT